MTNIVNIGCKPTERASSFLRVPIAIARRIFNSPLRPLSEVGRISDAYMAYQLVGKA